MIKWRVHQGFLTDRERRMDILKAMEWFTQSNHKTLQIANLSLKYSTQYYLGTYSISTPKEWIRLLEYGSNEKGKPIV